MKSRDLYWLAIAFAVTLFGVVGASLYTNVSLLDFVSAEPVSQGRVQAMIQKIHAGDLVVVSAPDRKDVCIHLVVGTAGTGLGDLYAWRTSTSPYDGPHEELSLRWLADSPGKWELREPLTSTPGWGDPYTAAQLKFMRQRLNDPACK